ncbi:MAG: universal stress protein [Magnetospirillum sp. WYHS-4]
MTIRSILVSIDGSEAGAAPLEAAVRTAARLDAHLDVLHVRPDSLTELPAIGEAMPDHLAHKIAGHTDRQSDLRAEAARRQFDAALASIDLRSAAWVEKTGRRHMVLQRLGRVHDLIVVGRPSHRKDISGSLVMDALFETGRPVLVVPPGFSGEFGRRIAIAWNGSPQCARAIGGATNFFGSAEEVVALTAESHHTPVSVVPELAAYLERHAAKVRTRVFAHMGKKPMGGKALLTACAEENVDLLVMGARRVARWRWRDLLLGHATGQVLRHTTLPVLMGH